MFIVPGIDVDSRGVCISVLDCSFDSVDGFAAQPVTIADGHGAHVDDKQFAASSNEDLLAGNSHEHRPAVHLKPDYIFSALAIPIRELHEIECSSTGHA